ncbi:MAG: ribosome biogenesis GTPase Der [Gammaproteobacteria bacterium]|nr:ribosome biogenesis GTPase Der [Gammaproteobacteria bacterium]
MLPVVAIVGAPNVGKSTLFNRLTGSRAALVGDEPGVTRDRQYGFGDDGQQRFVLIDTGGISQERAAMARAIAGQAELAMEEADALIFLLDARAGPSATEAALADQLRRSDKRIFLAINKSEGLSADVAAADFHELGLGTPYAISAARGSGVRALTAQIMASLAIDTPAINTAETTDEDDTNEDHNRVRIAVIGRPNVGKSTLVNRLLKEERMIAHDAPGTTRDSISIPFEHGGKPYVLVDTAGIRRRARVNDRIEKWSALKTLQSIEAANVVLLLADGSEGVTEQDVTLLRQIERTGRALVIGINKWDGLNPEQRVKARRDLDLKLGFIDYANIHYISALHGSGVGNLLSSVDAAWAAASANLATPELNELLQEAMTRHPPPLVRGRRIRLRYAHQGGTNPPRVIIHGNRTEAVPSAYRRYLTRYFRQALALHGTPISMEFRTGENPFKDRKNTLTPGQQRRRKRLIKHVKRRR